MRYSKRLPNRLILTAASKKGVQVIGAILANTGSPASPQPDDIELYSFHAIPLKDEAAGDTYRKQIAESARLVEEKLGIAAGSITVAFQSVFGHDASKWTAPLSRDILQSWRDGSFRVVFACPGFSVDCLETLYDIPHAMVPALEGEGAAPLAEHVEDDVQSVCNTSGRFAWVPTLNTSDEHTFLIKAVLDKAIATETAARI